MQFALKFSMQCSVSCKFSMKCSLSYKFIGNPVRLENGGQRKCGDIMDAVNADLEEQVGALKGYLERVLERVVERCPEILCNLSAQAKPVHTKKASSRRQAHVSSKHRSRR